MEDLNSAIRIETRPDRSWFGACMADITSQLKRKLRTPGTDPKREQDLSNQEQDGPKREQDRSNQEQDRSKREEARSDRKQD